MSQAFKLMIIDDSCEARELLLEILMERALFQMLDSPPDLDKALQLTIENRPDLVILDIQMLGEGVFLYINKLKTLSHVPGVIILSASEEYAIAAIKHGVYDYLIKPVSKDELLCSIKKFLASTDNHQKYYSKLLGLLEKSRPERFKLNSQAGYFFIDPEQIVYAEADGNRSHIQLACGKKETTFMGLGAIGKMLDHKMLIRISRSHIINLDFIVRVDKGEGICELEYSGVIYQARIGGKNMKLIEQSLG
jgi:two-component system LytT family response regulator